MRVHDCGNFFSIVWYRRWGPYKRAICFFIDIWNHSTSCKSSNKISIIFSQLVNCLCSLAAEQQQRVYVYRHHTGVSKVPTLNRHLIASGGILKYFLIVCRTSPNPHVDISKRNGHRKSWKGPGMIGAPIFFATPLLLLLQGISNLARFQSQWSINHRDWCKNISGSLVSFISSTEAVKFPTIYHWKNEACPGKKTFAFSFIDNIISSSSFEVF